MADKNMEAQISVEFEEATSRQSLNSGETINTLWGKVKRWLSDLKAVAFSGSYVDLSDRPTTATTSADGLMSAEDKGKLDAFEITTTGGKLHDKDIATTDLIPTSLPANGGNADTVDGLHASDFIKNTSDWKSMNFEITYGDHNYPNVIDNNIPIMPKTCNYTHIISRARSDNSIISILSIPSDYDDDIFLYQSISGVWKNIADGGNADTLDGLHADVFLKNTVMQGLATSINDAITPDVYGVSSATPDLPGGYGSWGFLEIRRYGNVCYQTIIFDSGVIINRVKNITSVNWSEWQEIYTSGNKPYVTGTLSEQASDSPVTMSFTIFDFTPSKVICQFGNGNAFFANVVTNGFSLTIPAGTTTIHYIAFK